MKEKNKLKFWISWFMFAILIIISYRLLDKFDTFSIWFKNTTSIFMPFISAILLAYLLYMPCSKLEKLFQKIKIPKKIARPISIFLIYILTLIIIIIFINKVFPAISKSILDLTNNLPNYYKNAMGYIENIKEDSIISKDTVKEIIYSLQKINIAKIFDYNNIQIYIKGALGIATTVFKIFVTIVMSIYILLERTKILEFIYKLNKALYKKETAKAINKYFIKTNQIFFKFISSQVLDAIIVGIIISIAMWLLGIKYGILLGLTIGLFNIIPYFGSIVAITMATIITILTGGFSQAFFMLFILIILQQIDANIINPKIIGNALKLSPILVIFSVTIGGAYFGVLGMFLAVPVIAFIKILINDFINYKLDIKEKEL